MTPAEALSIARDVASEAAALLRGAKVRDIRTKSSFKDLVTEWDERAEQLIVARLHERTPGVALLAEESGATGDVDAGDRWVIDPIDGTVNFAHGIPFYAVCISLEREGEPIAGVINAPAMGWELYGSAGGGAFANGEPMRVSEVGALSQALLTTGFPYDRATARFANFEEWEHLQRTAGACRRFGCASLDLAMVARGWLDGYWERALQPWDISAGALLVREAGGQVTSLTGGPFSSSSGEACASNGAIHKELLDALAAVERTKNAP